MMPPMPARRIRIPRHTMLSCALVLALGLHAAQTRAQISLPDGIPALIQAEEMTYDRELGTVQARGKVEITQGERTLLADRVTYNQKTDTVIASGNVVLMEPGGDVLFAEYVELKDGFKEGIVNGIRVLFSDKSRLAASVAIRTGGRRTVMEKAVYSPCRTCRENPDRPLLWQLKARKVTHDQVKKSVVYEDARLEFFGVPVAYTPYFSHPDPTVKRRSGFLAPSFASSDELGAQITIPYYWAIAPNRDATISPRLTSSEGLVLGGEYRERTFTGQYSFDGSVTYVDERDANNNKTGDQIFRGHLFGTGNFALNDQAQWGFDLARASDDTYLQRYDISSADVLRNRLYVEAINGRNYAAANAYYFQDLRLGNSAGQTPIVLPQLIYRRESEPSIRGGILGFGAETTAIQRRAGTDTRRFSLQADWTLPITTNAGEIYTLTALLRGDLYWINDFDSNGDGNGENSLVGRLLPQVALEWRYPFIRSQGTIRQTVEPVVSVVASPSNINNDDIPNEDSQSIEFDDTNLFSLNRYSGADRQDDGSRINYGLRLAAYGHSGGYSSAFIGQSFRFTNADSFDAGSGLNDRLSDVVGHVTVAPNALFNVNFRFRLDPARLSLRRNESELLAGPEDYRLGVSYVRLARELTADNQQSREEISARTRLKIYDNWYLNANYRRDLSDNGGTINSGVGLQFLNECLDFSVFFKKDFTRDRDVEPSTTFGVRIKFKTLG